MFDELLRKYPPKDVIKPSKKCFEKNIAAVLSLIETEENAMTKRKFRLKPLIIAAVITILSLVSLFAVDAAMQGAVVKFFMGGEEIEGEYYDYVDSRGFRHIAFGAVLPIYETNFAIIYDVDAPMGENVRVITDETDPDFMDRLRQLKEAQEQYWDDLKAWYDEHNITQEDIRDPNSEFNKTYGSTKKLDRPYPEPEDFGLVFKESELCTFRLGYTSKTDFAHHDGTLGGEFMHTGAAEGHPSGSGVDAPNECRYDWENETKTYKETFYYYVGKE
ncbi:MAG: hypothetical protein J1F28_04130 [Oscillospiraceae bacterium]|nr:hypothetical protein [Oscillospiraceae bacterium]